MQMADSEVLFDDVSSLGDFLVTINSKSGKLHKKYEYGCKVGVATTSSDSFFGGAKALQRYPNDGNLLKQSMK